MPASTSLLIDYKSQKVMLPSVLAQESGISTSQISYYSQKKGFVRAKTHFTLSGQTLKKFTEEHSIRFPELKQLKSKSKLTVFTEFGIKLLLDYALSSHINNWEREKQIYYFQSWFFDSEQEEISDSTIFMDRIVQSLQQELNRHINEAEQISPLTNEDIQKLDKIRQCQKILNSIDCVEVV